MRKKQIEEMAVILTDGGCTKCNCDENGKFNCLPMYNAELLYNGGYRKQSDGCEFCGTTLYVKTVQHTMPLLAPITRADEVRHELLNLTGEIYLPLEAKFCPVCGKKMKGVQSDGEVY